MKKVKSNIHIIVIGLISLVNASCNKCIRKCSNKLNTVNICYAQNKINKIYSDTSYNRAVLDLKINEINKLNNISSIKNDIILIDKNNQNANNNNYSSIIKYNKRIKENPCVYSDSINYLALQIEQSKANTLLILDSISAIYKSHTDTIEIIKTFNNSISYFNSRIHYYKIIPIHIDTLFKSIERQNRIYSYANEVRDIIDNIKNNNNSGDEIKEKITAKLKFNLEEIEKYFNETKDCNVVGSLKSFIKYILEANKNNTKLNNKEYLYKSLEVLNKYCPNK